MKSPESQKEGADMVHKAAEILKDEVGHYAASKIVKAVAEHGADALPAISTGWQYVKATLATLAFHGAGMLSNIGYSQFMNAVRHGAGNMWPQAPPRIVRPATLPAHHTLPQLPTGPNVRNAAFLSLPVKTSKSSGNWRLYNVQNPMKRVFRALKSKRITRHNAKTVREEGWSAAQTGLTALTAALGAPLFIKPFFRKTSE